MNELQRMDVERLLFLHGAPGGRLRIASEDSRALLHEAGIVQFTEGLDVVLTRRGLMLMGAVMVRARAEERVRMATHDERSAREFVAVAWREAEA